MIAYGIGNHLEGPSVNRRILHVRPGLSLYIISVKREVSLISLGQESMTQGTVLPYFQCGQQGLEKLNAVSHTVLGIGLLNLCQVNGTLEHLT